MIGTRLRKAILAVVSVLVLAACTNDGGGGSSASDGLVIGLSMPSQSQVRWGVEAKAFEAQASQNGDRVLVNFANWGTAKQTADVEAMMQQGIDVLVLSPVDTTAAGALVARAQAAGIKVITYDATASGAKADFAVQRNNYDAGKLQVDAALAAVPRGKYAIIRGEKSTSVGEGYGRAYDELLLTNPDIDVVYDQWTPGWDATIAQRSAEAALLNNANDIDAFVVTWDGGAQSVVQALKSAGVPAGKVFISGTDGEVPTLQSIAQDWQTMTVWTRIDKMARDAATIAHDLGTGAAPPTPDDTVDGVPVHYAELMSVDRENLCDFTKTVAPEGWVPAGAINAPGYSCD